MSTPRTPPLSMVLFLVAAVLGAVGQFLYKSGAERAGRSLPGYLNVRILGGVVCYVAAMVLFVAAFKRGGALSVLYPLYAPRSSGRRLSPSSPTARRSSR